MLQNLREHTQGWIATVIALILCVAFALWGIQYYLSGNNTHNAIAKVNGEEITQQQFNSAYKLLRQQLHLGEESSTSLDQAEQTQLKSTALQGLISQVVLANAATRNGFRISNNQMSAIIAAVPFFQMNGQFVPTLFQRFVDEFYSSEQAFVNDLKQKALVLQVKSGITATAFALPSEINNALILANQKRDIAWLILPQTFFLKNVKVSDADVQAYYASHKQNFMTNEQLSIQYIELSGDQVSKKIPVTEQEIQQYYQDNKATFTSPTQWQIAHITVKLPENADPKALSAAQTKINSIAQQIQSGQDFAKMALQFSDDKATAISGGVVGWVSSAQQTPQMAKVVQTLSPGQVSAPFKTADGFELIKLLAVKKGEALPLEAARTQVENTLRRQKAEQLLADQSDQLANLTYTNPDTLKVAADALGLPIQTSELFTRKGSDSGLTANPKIVNAAFSDNVLKQHNNSDVITVDSQTLVVLRVAQHKPPMVRPLAEVQASIRNDLTAEFARKAAMQAGEKIIQDLQQGIPKDQIALPQGLTFTQKTAITRKTTDMPAEILQLAFSLPAMKHDKPSIGGQSLSNGDFAVVMINKILPGVSSQADPKERQLLQQDIENHLGALDYYLYTTQQMHAAKIKYEEDPQV
ncbi:MAG TPA: SurA N-terminal domain-containing protein [Gammaproteobacteria bacterium]|nr:SurA N-terminal domain-containing protein [Gammaproteobacteria bacterium]